MTKVEIENLKRKGEKKKNRNAKVKKGIRNGRGKRVRRNAIVDPMQASYEEKNRVTYKMVAVGDPKRPPSLALWFK